MFQYVFNYVRKDGMATIRRINSAVFKDVVESLKLFLIEDRFSYNDEDFSLYTPKKLLKIALDEYKMNVITIDHYVIGEKIKKSSFHIEDLYWRYERFEANKKCIVSCDEVVLQDQKYDYEGLDEGTLCFVYKNGNMVPLTRFYITGGEINFKPEANVFYEYVEFENGLGIVDDIYVKEIPGSLQDVLKIFQEWSRAAGIDISKKTITFDKKEMHFESEELIQELEDQDLEDPDHLFAMPSKFVKMYLQNKYPPVSELAEMLNEEPPGTIAAVIHNFKTETLLCILEGIPSPKKEEVIALLSQNSTLIDLFNYETLFIEERMRVLDQRFVGGIASLKAKSKLRKIEENTINEYTLWVEKLIEIKKSP